MKLGVPSEERGILRFVERNPVNDRIVFWIRALADDLAVKILSHTPAGDVLYGHWLDETPFAESCVSPFNKCAHDFSGETLSVRGFLEPKPEFGRKRTRILEVLDASRPPSPDSCQLNEFAGPSATRTQPPGYR
jgi:hypothetical protein